MSIEQKQIGIGKRLEYCRHCLSLTRKRLIDRWGIVSITTLSRWELGTVSVPQKKLAKLSEFFRNEGLTLNDEWLLSGEGFPPQLLGKVSNISKDFDSAAQEHFLSINQCVPDFTFGKVSSNHMAPFVNYGDFIGGRNLFTDRKSELVPGALIFAIYQGNLDIGLYEESNGEVILKNHLGKIISVNESAIKSMGSVTWINRRP